ncbi:hypothetical protein [Methylibium rhizosphaerae]|uniref:hypothetical protein n=1 Tax=Methylibium rhizosphaerae TaxID=2570323 RepID=UPI0011275A83|nr:hypothetical protein [Methylibium rhizosphaerae]
MIPQPQVIEYCDEIPPEFTRTSFADLFDRPAPPPADAEAQALAQQLLEPQGKPRGETAH